MYQSLDNDTKVDLEGNTDDINILQTIPSGGFSIRDVVKTGIFLTIFVLFASLSVQTKTNFSRTTGINSVISQLTSLDQLPKETIFGEVSDENKEYIFNLYSKKYSKNYFGDEEYKTRLSTFKSTLDLIDVKNSNERLAGGSARHGVTKYSDMSASELKSKLLSGRKQSTGNEVTERMRGEAVFLTISPYAGAYSARDWSEVMTTPVIDQGFCGSCWAWSTVFQLESDAIRKQLLTPDETLSVQQLLSCDSIDEGCNGGWTELGFAYAMETPILLSSAYPYESHDLNDGTTPQCALNSTLVQAKASNAVAIKVDNFYGISTEEEMISYVLSTGPLSICAASNDWMTYVEGVITACSGEVDHCVQIVGVDLDQGYWKVRNTWGTDWGEAGYIRLALGSNLCGIVTDALYADVSLVH